MKPEALVVGRTYYQLTFADRDFTMPGVEPLVYLGDVTLEDGSRALAFQDTVSYVWVGSGLDPSVDRDDAPLHLIPPSDIERGIMDIGSIAEEVAAAARRAEAMNYPVLPVRKGSKGAS